MIKKSSLCIGTGIMFIAISGSCIGETITVSREVMEKFGELMIEATKRAEAKYGSNVEFEGMRWERDRLEPHEPHERGFDFD